MALATKDIREAEEVRDLNLGAQRMCTIFLKPEYTDADGNPKRLRLAWHTGRPSPNAVGSAQRKTMLPGDSYRTDLARAQAWFGMFTVPVTLQSVYDESKRARLVEQFETEKRRAIMTWGEYPRGQTYGPDNNGGNPLGPARIPPVVLTVEEADGTSWEPIDLRELYDLGEYYEAEPVSMAYRRPVRESEQKSEELEAMRIRMAQLEGMLMAFGQTIRPQATAEPPIEPPEVEPETENEPIPGNEPATAGARE